MEDENRWLEKFIKRSKSNKDKAEASDGCRVDRDELTRVS